MSMKNNIRKYIAILAVIGTTIVVGCGNKEDNLDQNQPLVQATEKPATDETGDPEPSSEPSLDETVTDDSSEEDTSSETSDKKEEIKSEKEEDKIEIRDETNKDELKEQTKEEVKEEVKEESKNEQENNSKTENNDIAPVIGEVDPTIAQEIVYVSTNGIELPEGGAMSKDMFAKTYGISTEGLNSYYIHIPIKSSYATEIAVFEVKDDVTKKAVLKGIEKRQQGLLAQFKNGDVAEFNLVENYRIAEKGNTVIFVVSKQADKIVEQFNNM